MKNKFVIVYGVIVLILFISLAVLYSNLPKPTDWTPSFEKNKETPYGSKLVYENLSSIFTKSPVSTINKSIYDQLHRQQLLNTNYIFVCKQFEIDDLDMRTLLDYVAIGNDVFIATNELSSNIQDTLGFYFNIDLTLQNPLQKDGKERKNYVHEFKNKSFGQVKKYEFKAVNYPSDIIIIDTIAFKVLAVNQQNEPIFVSTTYGNGHLYLHAFPYAISNYYLLHKNNHEYISKCLSVLPNRKTYWDEYYKKDHDVNNQQISPIHFILSTPSLRWAWYITLGGIVFYVVFRLKRQQRIIPIIKPYANSSLQFIKTLGRLYYNKGDHTDIVKKQVSYWLEYIRTRLFVSTAKLDQQFITSVAEKSGVSLAKIEEIIYAITDMKNNTPSKKEVINFYKKLDYFYKNTKR